MTSFNFVWLIPLLPLLGSVVNGLAGGRIGRRAVGAVACSAVGFAFAAASVIQLALLQLPADRRLATVTVFQWFSSGALRIDAALLVDPLSILMALVVTGVGFLIHVYSVGYMHDDKAYGRYFSYLNLFVFFMLVLVLSADYVVLYLGWEGVGLCSYLLIGFWYEKKAAADAGKKAFIVNRVGDFGFILGIFLLFWTLSDQGVYSLKFAAVFDAAPRLEPAVLTAVTLLLFAGAVGKSAQFPLHVWLPDAMEGPTPVSALIHAATMVTAGVFMVARNSVLFALAPFTAELVAGIGIFTAFFAATIALVQNDIKKVLAYSTISQLGYMFAAVGIGAYAAGIFHLMTHAFFKGLLFLGAGSVIHAMGGEQDMRRMGGLLSPLKTTAITFIVGATAIAGIPPFSGFWSKDEILWEAFAKGHPFLWSVGLLTAFLTAFYMFRQVFMVFAGRSRADEQIRSRVHESPPVMTAPLIALAVLAVAGGWVGIPFFKGGSPLHHYLEPVFFPEALKAVAGHGQAAAAGGHGALAWVLMGVSVAAALLGTLLAACAYLPSGSLRYLPHIDPAAAAARFKTLHRLLSEKYHVDDIYDVLIVEPVLKAARYCLHFDLSVIDGLVNAAGWLTRLTAWLSHKIDIYLIDGLVNSLATLVGINSGLWRRLQTGYLQNYALVFIAGLVLIVVGVLLVA